MLSPNVDLAQEAMDVINRTLDRIGVRALELKAELDALPPGSPGVMTKILTTGGEVQGLLLAVDIIQQETGSLIAYLRGERNRA